MKKTFLVLSNLLFFLCVSFLVFTPTLTMFGESDFSFALKKEIKSLNKDYVIVCDGRIFYFSKQDFPDLKLSDYQKQIRANVDLNGWFLCLKEMGFSQKEVIEYIFPESKEILKIVKNSTEKEPQKNKISVIKNTCSLSFQNGKSGRFIDEFEFYEKFEKEILKNEKIISLKIHTKEYSFPKINKNEYVEKSCFSTNFETSSPERKNNIKVALSAFDGLVLEDGEILSFNATTGVRNEKAGYKKAKIISGGTFTEGFGGGVCQVSTTLYNACLLSGLEILEVHNHSLPVSYIEPSFDAMVNIGSSDLVVRNNSGGKLIFTSSSKDDVCKVKIFGKPNEFKITRFSEKTKVIDAVADEILSDAESIKKFSVDSGEEKRISYSKDGFVSNGYLNFYDKSGSLIKTKKIRTNTYNPTRGIIVKNTLWKRFVF